MRVNQPLLLAVSLLLTAKLGFAGTLANSSAGDIPTDLKYYTLQDEPKLHITAVDNFYLSSFPTLNNKFTAIPDPCETSSNPKSGNLEVETMKLSPDSVLRLVGQFVDWFLKTGNPKISSQKLLAHVLPAQSTCWKDLTGWKKSPAYKFTYSYKNLYGMTVAKISYLLRFNYNGSYKNRGKYLANVTITPSNIELLKFFELEAAVLAAQPLNYGTINDPIAGLETHLSWTVKSPVKAIHTSLALSIDGLGQLTYY